MTHDNASKTYVRKKFRLGHLYIHISQTAISILQSKVLEDFSESSKFKD